MELASLRLRLHGGIRLEGMLKLIVGASAIEGVRTKIAGTQSCMPVHLDVAVLIAALIESLSAIEIAVELSSLAAAVAVGTGIAS